MANSDFQLEISPHQSLSPRGFACLIGTVAAVNFTGGIVLWWLGAWPVIGFMGIDVALIWLGFRLSFRKGLKKERITITEHELLIERLASENVIETLNFARGFVQVFLEHDEGRNIVGRLWVRSKGRGHQIGAFLGAEERAALAQILKSNLARPKI